MLIKDLTVSAELDAKALTAVRGGQDNQAIGTAQQNTQNMLAAANVGNGSLFVGPATIQSDNTFTQDAHNDNFATNASLFAVLGGFPLVRGL